MTAPITVDRITLHNQALAIDAYLARPTAPGSYPGIIVFQEIFGVNAHIRDVADRLAREGYIAIAPALYQRSQPGFEVSYTADDMAIGRQYKDATRADELIGDTRAAIAYLETIDGYNGNLGTIGFCFGGHVAYLIATLPEIKATASFYGAGIPVFCPGETDPTITRTPQIQGEIYCFFGMADPLIPAEQNAAVEAALQQAKIKHRVFRYPGVDHGFFCDRRDSYNAEATKAAWNEVKALFGRLQ
jgi:carboxymethylenebutenolidase